MASQLFAIFLLSGSKLEAGNALTVATNPQTNTPEARNRCDSEKIESIFRMPLGRNSYELISTVETF